MSDRCTAQVELGFDTATLDALSNKEEASAALCEACASSREPPAHRQEHLLAPQEQVRPKGQHLVPKLVAQQTSVAAHCSAWCHDAHRFAMGHLEAEPLFPVPVPGWHEP
mmetsp:Transcript_56221/g.164280  ORF Transcript_56221/g.164280 Transcript_56221/m.164280 type:complete len:110 (-) Transcript_56221:1649-1978(-)